MDRMNRENLFPVPVLTGVMMLKQEAKGTSWFPASDAASSGMMTAPSVYSHVSEENTAYYHGSMLDYPQR